MAYVASTVTSADLETVAGGKLYVSATLPATYDAAGYNALTWTEIGGVTDLPSFGGTANMVNYDLLSEGYTSKAKGQGQYGSGTFNYASVPADAGQIIIAAAAVPSNAAAYSFRALYSNGTSDSVTALVMGAPKNNGTADTVQAHAAAIEYVSVHVSA